MTEIPKSREPSFVDVKNFETNVNGGKFKFLNFHYVDRIVDLSFEGGVGYRADVSYGSESDTLDDGLRELDHLAVSCNGKRVVSEEPKDHKFKDPKNKLKFFGSTGYLFDRKS